MSNKPVAWMETYKGKPNNLDWDKSNLNYGSEFHDVVPLYTHPVKKLDEDFDAICLENKILQAEIEVLKAGKIRAYDNGVEDGRKPNTNPVKELTNEEINDAWKQSHEDGIATQQGFTTQQHYFAHLILRKAREK